MKCLYMNARSLVNKTTEFQTLATDIDLIAVTESWLKPDILNSELLPGPNFTSTDEIERIKSVEGYCLP